jgi:hypothetical protein
VPSTPPAAIEVAPQAASSTWILAAVIALVLLVTVALFVRSRYRYASESSAPPSPQSTPAATTTPSPSPPPSPAARPESAARAPEIPSAPAPPVVAAPAPKPARPAGAQSAEVLDARLCSALDLGENWRCAPVEGSVTDGAVFFVTRIRSTADATIEHRWYRGDRLHQSVTLHIRPLAGGYRTYSRMTVNSERAGNWRVELRSSDGTVLDSKQFTVAR